ncbi:MAG: molecular chaperone [Bacteroidetes bacterium]|nr:molecular chaperone [Bacteroidota bacterium]
MAISGDQILPFYLVGERGAAPLVRGRLASVGLPVTGILGRHGYPYAVASLQAEALAIAACLSTFMKFDGVFTLQAKGDGYVKTLFADMTSTGAMRGYTAFDDTAESPVADDVVGQMPASVPDLLGKGYAAFTVDQGTENGRYQGIVELAGDTLSDAAMAWFANSEQVDSAIIAAAGLIDGQWTASALMLQRIAVDGGTQNSNVKDALTSGAEADDVWHTAQTLLKSVKRDELVDPDLAPETLVFRLFNSLQPHVAPTTPVIDQCRCSPEKVEAVLERMPGEQVADLIADSGMIEVTCEFCKTMRSITPSSHSSSL